MLRDYRRFLTAKHFFLLVLFFAPSILLWIVTGWAFNVVSSIADLLQDGYGNKLDDNMYPGLYRLHYKTPEKPGPAATATEAENNLYSFLTQTTVGCSFTVRLGNRGDGGWDACLLGPYNLTATGSCLVYSFGIGGDWSFDDAVSRKFGCEVYSFDPSIRRPKFYDRQTKLATFYKVGLTGRKATPGCRAWNVASLRFILDTLGHRKRDLSYLKIDIEGSEWDALSDMIQDGCLKHVRQLAFEIHLDWKVIQGDRHSIQKVWNVLEKLEALGFVKWKYHLNPHNMRTSQVTHKNRTKCYELYYLNANFL